MSKPIIKMMYLRKARGFTLIELIVVILIAGLLAAAAVPAYSSFVASQRIKTASFDLMSTMIFARSEAIKRNTNVTFNIAPVAKLTRVFTGTAGAPGTILREQSLFTGLNFNCKTALGGAITPCPSGGLVFTSSGRLGNGYLPMELSNTVATTSEHSRCITVDLSGRPHSKKGAC